MCFQIKKIHRGLNSANEKRSSSMYIIIIFQNTRDKNKISKAIKRKQITKQKSGTRMAQDFSRATLKARRRNTFKILMESHL